MDSIFAPPTEQEMQAVAQKRKKKQEDLFAPPTESELASIKKPVKESPMITAEGLKEAAIEAIPALGSVLGGGLGFVSPVPGGALAGATLGGAAGAYGKQIVESLLGEPEAEELAERMADKSFLERQVELAREPVKEAALGAAGEGAGALIGKAVAPVAKAFMKAAPTKLGVKEGAEEIVKAGERLGVEPTAGMVTDSPVLQGLESSLEQSPTMAAYPVRKQKRIMGEAVQDVLEKAKEGGSLTSKFETGTQIKEGTGALIKQRQAPAKALYSEIEPEFANIAINKDIMKQEVSALGDNPIFKNKQGQEYLANIQSEIDGLDSLADLKIYRSSLMDRVPGTASNLEKNWASKAYDVVTGVRDKTLSQLDPGEVTGDVLAKIKEADSIYRKNISDVNRLKGLVGQKKDFKSVNQFLDKLNEIPETNVLDKVFQTNKVNELYSLKDLFPEQFETIRKAKVSDIIDRATTKQGISPRMFIRQFDNIPDETKKILFDVETLEDLTAMKTIVNNLPEKIGPSGTPQGMLFQNITDALTQLRDVGRLALYKGMARGGVFQGPREAISTAGQTLAAPQVPRIAGQFAAREVESPTFELTPENHAQYIQEVKDDESLSNIEKAKRRNLANRKKVGIMDEQPQVAPQITQQQRPDLSSIAGALRRTR